MAYNNGFPVSYPQIYPQQQFQPQPPYQQMMQQPMQPTQQAQQVQPQQIQQPQPVQYPIVQGGFVRVRNENEARTYFVAPGNSVTFINEDSTYLFTKTVEINQLDRPKFEKYKLVKEEEDNAQPQHVEQEKSPLESRLPDMSRYVTKDAIDDFRADLEAIRNDMETFRSDLYGIAGKKKTTATKKEPVTDE